MVETIKRNWFFNVRGDVLAGIVVALALIPEAIALQEMVLGSVSHKVVKRVQGPVMIVK